MFVLVVRNNSNNSAVESSFMLSAYLESQNIAHQIIDANDAALDVSDLKRLSFWENIENSGVICDLDNIENEMIIVVLGGDGTILKSARFAQGRQIPILGINFGHLGFLANSDEQGVIDIVSRALVGELAIERRANLEVTVECKDGEGELEAGAYSQRKFFALNELAATQGSLGLSIDYSINISDVAMANISGNGVIVASATGSTAYALSAGGPLVEPSFDGMIVQPLAPHTLTARAILTNSSDVVCVDFTKTRPGRPVSLFVDGDILEFDTPVERVFVRRGEAPTTLLYADGNHFYKYAASTFFK